MTRLHKLALAAFGAAFFIAGQALAQNAGTVSAHAFAIGKGAGTTGYTSLLCGSAQLAVGQSAADPICKTITGDVTISAAGVTAIGAGKVASSMLADTAVTPGSYGSASVITTFTVNSKGQITAASNATAAIPVGQITGLGTGIATWLATPSSANLASAVTDETGSGKLVFGTSPTLTTPAISSPTGLVKGDVGLGNVDNTSDATKWAATATLTNKTFDTAGTGNSFSINGVAATANTGTGAVVRAASPALTGTPTAPTASPSDNSTKIATTAYVDAQVAGGVAGVASLNGQTGALTSYFPPQGRLTLATGTPVMTTTQSAKTTIYYTPYVGNMIPLYDGSNMVPVAFSELSIATTDTTHNPAAIGASKVNDWFVWNDSGTLRLSHGPDWTNDTTRSAGTALTMVNGILLNSVSITNGPAASRGTYVGTTRSNGSSQLDWIFGSSASGGGQAWFGVWNMYNRVLVTTTVTDSTSSWTTGTSATFATMNSSAANRISAVFGNAEDGSRISLFAGLSGVTTAFAGVNAGFALDAGNTADKYMHAQSTSSGLQVVVASSVENTYAGLLGFHFWQATQSGDGTNAGSIAGGTRQGFSGEFRM